MKKLTSGDVLKKLYKNAQMAILSIEYTLPFVEEPFLKEEIKKEYAEYENIASEILTEAKKLDLSLNKINPFQKAMLFMSINFSFAFNKTKSRIAEKMVKGTVMGITELMKMQETREFIAEEVSNLLTKLLNLEETFEKNLKNYL